MVVKFILFLTRIAAYFFYPEKELIGMKRLERINHCWSVPIMAMLSSMPCSLWLSQKENTMCWCAPMYLMQNGLIGYYKNGN